MADLQVFQESLTIASQQHLPPEAATVEDAACLATFLAGHLQVGPSHQRRMSPLSLLLLLPMPLASLTYLLVTFK